MKILLIEDEEELRNTVREYLTREKFIVECAEDYASAMEKVNDYRLRLYLAGHHAAQAEAVFLSWPISNGCVTGKRHHHLGQRLH